VEEVGVVGGAPIKRHRDIIEPRTFLLAKMTITTPFYPMSRKEKDRCLKEPLEQDHSWGEITNRGWKLRYRACGCWRRLLKEARVTEISFNGMLK